MGSSLNVNIDLKKLLGKKNPKEQFAENEEKRMLTLQRILAGGRPNNIGDATQKFPGLTVEDMQKIMEGDLGSFRDEYDAKKAKSLGIDSKIKRDYEKAATESTRIQGETSKIQGETSKTQAAENVERTITSQLARDPIEVAIRREASTSQSKENTERTITLESARKRKEAAKPIADRAAATVGVSNLWTALEAGKFTSEQADALMAIESYAEIIKMQQSTDARTKERVARASGDITEANTLLARQMAYKTGTPVDVRLVVRLLEDPRLGRILAGKEKKDVPEEQHELWEAAQVRRRYNDIEGRERKKEIATTFKTYFPRLGDLQAGKIGINDKVIAELNSAAKLAYKGTEYEAPTYTVGYIKRKGLDTKIIVRIGGEDDSYLNPVNAYIEQNGKEVKVSPDGLLDEGMLSDIEAEKKIRAKYPDATEDQIQDAVARVRAESAKKK